MIHLAPLAPVPSITFEASQMVPSTPSTSTFQVTSPILLELENDNFEAFRTQEILTRQGYHLKRQQVPSCREESVQSIHFIVNLVKI